MKGKFILIYYLIFLGIPALRIEVHKFRGKIVNYGMLLSKKMAGMIYKYHDFYWLTIFTKMILGDNSHKEVSRCCDCGQSVREQYLVRDVGGFFTQGTTLYKNNTNDIQFTKQDFIYRLLFACFLNKAFRPEFKFASLGVEAFLKKTLKTHLSLKIKANFQL